MKYYQLQFTNDLNFSAEYYVQQDDGFQPAQLYPPHIHDSLEFYMLFDGEASFMVEDKLYKIKPGDVIMSKPNHLHNCVRNTASKHKHACIWLTTQSDLLCADFLGEEVDPVISFTEADKNRLFGLHNELDEAGAKNDERKILRLLLQITEIYRDNLAQKGSAEKEKIPSVLKQILADVNEHFAIVNNLEYFTKKW